MTHGHKLHAFHEKPQGQWLKKKTNTHATHENSTIMVRCFVLVIMLELVIIFILHRIERKHERKAYRNRKLKRKNKDVYLFFSLELLLKERKLRYLNFNPLPCVSFISPRFSFRLLLNYFYNIILFRVNSNVILLLETTQCVNPSAQFNLIQPNMHKSNWVNHKARL